MGWGGAALFFGLVFIWHPLFIVAAVLFGAWLVTYVAVMALALGQIILGWFGFEVRRKRH